MRVVVCPSDRGGCGYYRLRWAAETLQAHGADIEVVQGLPARWERTSFGNRLHSVTSLGADVVVWQRVFRPDLLAVMGALKANGVGIVLDLDDDFMALDSRHPVFAELHPTTGPKSWAVLREAIQIADVVTVSTPALAAKYGGSKARVVPNGVPRAYLGIERASERRSPPVMGWTGRPDMHVGDLGELGTVPRDLCRAGLARFRAIGAAETLEVLEIPAHRAEHQPGVALADLSYARVYADLDIAVVPLRQTAFNAGKSWLKMAEAAALGVPVVTSPTPENVRLHNSGIGFLAKREREWERHLTHLLQSPDLRLAESARGRAVMAGMTIEDWVAPQVWDAWTAAVRATPAAV